MARRWKIKQKPQDFVVREVIFDEVEASWKEKYGQLHGKHPERDSRYLWFTLKKTDQDFFTVIGSVARKLKLGVRDIGYAGTKDRHAITYQTISVPAEKEDAVSSLDIPGLEVSNFRYRNRAIKLGEHKGNDFEITVRNIQDSEIPALEKRIENVRRKGMINYFGGQRFGSVKNANDSIGKMLVIDDIQGAVRKIMEGGGKYEKAASVYLKKKPGDYAGVLRQLPLRLLRLFLHAYQARIWNECARRYSGRNTAIPIVGHKIDVRNYPRIRKILEEVLEHEKIDARDFRNHSFIELSSRGTERDYIVVPKHLEYEFADDEMNSGKKKLIMSFFLPKGSYATEVVRQLSEN